MPDFAQLIPSAGLLLLGVAIGIYGTLIGAGGGFVLVPVLLLLFPHDSPARLTSISLAVVCANAISGSISYYRLKRADYKSGLWLAAATLPGAILGSVAVTHIPRGDFQGIMGVALVAAGAFLTIRPRGRHPLLLGNWLTVSRSFIDSEGTSYAYRFNLAVAVLISVGVGFVSSVLGIGGGIIHVPVLSTFFSVPEHVATATSHFVLMFTSGAGVATHVLQDDYAGTLTILLPLAIGVLVGAPVGAAFSRRISGSLIIRLLAIALVLVGARLLIGG